MKNKLYALFFFLPFFSNTYSQSTCATATEVFPTEEPVNITDNLKEGSLYFKFKATATACRIDVKSTNATILIRFYSVCDGSFLQASTENTFIQGGLTVGNTYYYEAYVYKITAPSSYSQTLKVFSQTANDFCTGAIELTSSSVYKGTVGNFSGATPSGAYYERMPDVWYKFKATSKAVSIQVQPSGFNNATIEIFDSCGAKTPMTLAAGNTLMQGGLIIGKTYYYRFYGDISTVSASYTTGVVALSNSVAHDECDGAIEVTPKLTYAPITGDFTNATASWPSRGVDVWYKFKASTNAAIIRMSSTRISADITLYANCNNKKLATGITLGTYKEIRLGGLVPTQTYYYKIEANQFPVTNGSFTHGVVTIPNTPANDECWAAFPMNPTNSYTPIAGDFKNATPSLYSRFSMYDSTAFDDVWYKFVATAKAMKVRTIPSNATIGIELFKSCGGTAYSDYSFTKDTITFLSGGFVVGQTYFYKIYAKELPTENSSFTHSVMPIYDTPPNDDCENAKTVVPATSINWTIGNLKNATGSLGNNSFDIWFKFVATSTKATIYQENCNLEPYIAAFDACNGNVLPNGYNEKLTLTNLVVGKTYYYFISNGMRDCNTSYDIKTAVVVESANGINQEDISTSKIYPNPSKGSVTITHAGTGLMRAKIYDMSGQLFKDVSSSETIIVKDLLQGLYFVQLSESTSNRTVKLVVE